MFSKNLVVSFLALAGASAAAALPQSAATAANPFPNGFKLRLDGFATATPDQQKYYDGLTAKPDLKAATYVSAGLPVMGSVGRTWAGASADATQALTFTYNQGYLTAGPVAGTNNTVIVDGAGFTYSLSTLEAYPTGTTGAAVVKDPADGKYVITYFGTRAHYVCYSDAGFDLFGLLKNTASDDSSNCLGVNRVVAESV